MLARMFLLAAATGLVASSAIAQGPAPRDAAAPAWRPPGALPAAGASPAGAIAPAERTASLIPGAGPAGSAVVPARVTIATVTKGNGTLPSDQGQVWREYDISSYTARVTSTNRPEQAIVDWILRDTGYEAWHSETVSMLSADRRLLRVYHTPAMQQAVSEIVDRFVNSQAESQAFGVQVVTVGSPNWRSRAQRILHPIQTQAPGTQAWLLAKEDAATLLVQLARRTDFRSHTSPHLIINNGQPSIITLGQPRNYVRGVLESDGRAGLQSDVGQIFEGFSVELNPLLSLDGHMIDAIVKCNVEQVEKMIPVEMEVPGVQGSRQSINIEVPQVSGTRLQERFRWPTDKVLLISLGVVPSPAPGGHGAILWPLSGPDRADMLLMIDSKGNMPASASAGVAAPGAPRFVR